MSETDDRVAVSTYVPRSQKERWREQAEELDMSQSEFVRTMVQAGRREFDVPAGLGGDGAAQAPESAPQGDDGAFEDRILEVLEREGVLGWEELVDALVDDVEAELDAEIQALQDENLVRYSGREGGYVVVDGE